MGYSIRTDRHRFTRWVRAANPAEIAGLELYDHEADPQENVNLAGDAASAALLRDLAARLDAGWKAALPPP
jgi:iduronate 2-sulfatase